MTKRILVTGGAGFIGSHTVDQLLSKNFEVIVFDNLSSGKITNLSLDHPNLEFIEGDVLEFPYLKDLVLQVDAILHLAAITSEPISIENPTYTFQVNCQGFLHVLQAIKECKRPVRCVYASSAAVYGDTKELPFDDAIPLKTFPLSFLALQKKHAEDYAKMYSKLHGIETLGLRYFNVYGKRQAVNAGVIACFINALAENKNLIVYGDGLEVRDFISVADVARANCLALESDAKGLLNIATGKPQTILDIVNTLEEIHQKPLDVTFQTARTSDIQTSYGRIEKAEALINFKAEISLKKGLAQLLAT